MAEEIVIPDKPAFKASEVCELLKLQPYVLKSWENEFKDLGVTKSAGGPRVYRRVDVERAVRIRELMLRDGLTLAGVRRRLEQESTTADAEDALIAEIVASSAPVAAPEKGIDRERVLQVKQGLRELLETLSKPTAAGPGTASEEATSPAVASPRVNARAKSRRARGTVASAADPGAVVEAEAGATVASAPMVDKQPADTVTEASSTAGHEADGGRALRELTVVADEAPSLFGDDDPVAAVAPSSKAARRSRAPAAPASASD